MKHYIMNGTINYEAPQTWTVELKPSAVLANSYHDGGDGFTTDWNRDPGQDYKW
ncbi:MAG: hypothetical protein J5495_04395 [Bacteroidales bacterium]|nr:hypothetical protein [Bacteroidales bacterium]